MAKVKKWVLVVMLVALKLCQLPAPVRRVTGGLVRGRLSLNGRIYQYFGIPYATVNESNRFQGPLPPPQWDGIYDAVDENIRCPQRLIGDIIVGNMDCLKLNIYSPVETTNGKLRPVMVFIHGGGYLEGTGSTFLYAGDYFAEHGVVLVAINYRLSVEGFLCLGIKEAPGNAGLKDQLAALKWVKNNIIVFGGDPDNITLFGESAGASSVSYLILSNLAEGLFKRAILQSGSALCSWAMQHDPIKTASLLAKELGYNTKNPYELYNILSKKSVNELINAIQYRDTKRFITAEISFVPCIERELNGVDSFITKHPADIITSGNYTKVPLIIGVNDKEGAYILSTQLQGGTLNRVELVDIIQPDLIFPSKEDKNITNGELESYYYSLSQNIWTNLIEFYSDLFFKYPTAIQAEMFAKTTDKPIYYYIFKYNGWINMPKFIALFGHIDGATHADELFYMFTPYTFPLPQRFLEREMIDRMLTLWINFATYSNPTPTTSELIPVKWLPSREQNPIAFVIDKQLTVAPMWDEKSIRLWNDTYRKYRRRHYGFQYCECCRLGSNNTM